MKKSRFEEMIEAGRPSEGPPVYSKTPDNRNLTTLQIVGYSAFALLCLILTVWWLDDNGPSEKSEVARSSSESAVTPAREVSGSQELKDAQYKAEVEAINEAKPDFGFNQEEFQKRLAEAESKIAGVPKYYTASAKWNWRFNPSDHSYFTRIDGDARRSIHVYVKAKSGMIHQIHCRAEAHPSATQKEQFDFVHLIPLLVSTGMEPTISHEVHWENLQRLNEIAANSLTTEQRERGMEEGARIKSRGMAIEFFPPLLKFSFYPAALFTDD